MKTVIFGVSGFILLLVLMYYRKQQQRIHLEKMEELKRPQINVIPETVSAKLVEQMDRLASKFETRIEPKIRKFRILVNSAERNTTTYPSVTDYQLKLPYKIYGLEKIKLTKASFPTSLKLINSNNNLLNLSGTYNNSISFSYTITIPEGNYTAVGLSNVINDNLNSAASGDGASFFFSVNSNTYVSTTSIETIPSPGTSATFTFGNSDSYILNLLGISSSSVGTESIPIVGVGPVNVSYPQDIFLDLDNRAHDFNSLRVMSKAEDDRRTFASFTFPSGNGTSSAGSGSSGIPSDMTVSGSRVLVEGAGGVGSSGGSSGAYGNYVITKDQTNAYYKSYEGPIPSTEYLHVRLRQLLPNGTIGTPDFDNADHSLEFEIKARVDKISLTDKE